MMDLRQHMFVNHVPPHNIQELDQILSELKREIKFFSHLKFKLWINKHSLLIKKRLGFPYRVQTKSIGSCKKKSFRKILEPYNSKDIMNTVKHFLDELLEEPNSSIDLHQASEWSDFDFVDRFLDQTEMDFMIYKMK